MSPRGGNRGGNSGNSGGGGGSQPSVTLEPDEKGFRILASRNQAETLAMALDKLFAFPAKGERSKRGPHRRSKDHKPGRGLGWTDSVGVMQNEQGNRFAVPLVEETESMFVQYADERLHPSEKNLVRHALDNKEALPDDWVVDDPAAGRPPGWVPCPPLGSPIDFEE